ncbi:uncharacterized protein Dvar_53440 [Desulfosarcina variabilis str. Montpellier]
MIYVIEGTGSITLGDTAFQLKPGMIHFNPKAKVHSAKKTGEGYLVPIQKRRFSPDSGVGQQIQILKILLIFLRFEFVGRLGLGQNSPFLDGHYLIVFQAFTPKWDKPERVPVP